MTIRSLNKDDGEEKENGKKAIRLDWRNNNYARASRIFLTFLCRRCTLTTTLGARGFFSRATGSFVSSAEGQIHERRSGENKAFRAGHFLRLDRNRKPRMKSLWHPG